MFCLKPKKITHSTMATETSTSTTTTSAQLAEAIALSSQVRPSTVFTTADQTQAVQIRVAEINNTTPISIPDQFLQTVEQFPELVALKYKNDGEDGWQSVTYR